MSLDIKKFNLLNKSIINTSHGFCKMKKKHKNSNFSSSNYQKSKLSINRSSMSNGNKLKQDNIHSSNYRSSLEKIDKEDFNYKEYKENKKSQKNIKNSTKSLNINNELKYEKNRYLSRIKPLYDSFDDDESDRDEDNDGSCIHPTNKIVFLLDLFLFIFSLYSLFYIPLRMAKNDCFCGNENSFNKVLLYLIDILFIVDFCLGFFKAYYNFQFKIIKNNKRIILHYLKTDGFFDFLEAIPFFTYIEFLCKTSKEVNHCFKFNMANSLIVLKSLTNLKIFKIFKVRNKRKNVAFNHPSQIEYLFP